MRKTLIILLAGILVSACIYPFSAEIPGGDYPQIVISGDILIGEQSTIKLGYVYPVGTLTSEMKKEYPSGSVSIQNDLGQVFQGTYRSGGSYIVDTSTAPEDASYKLVVKLSDGRCYESAMSKVQPAPVIEDLSYRLDDNNVRLFIGMSGQGGTSHFRWDYVENWEFHADFIPDLMYVPGLSGKDAEDPAKIYRERNPEEDYYYCWSTASSVEPFLASTEGQSVDKFTDNNFFSISRSDRRVMVLYSILVTAQGLSEDGYAYLNHLNSVSNSAGSLFEPTPSDMPGNIVCVSDPSQVAIGFVEASVRVSQRLWVPACFKYNYDPELLLYYPEPDEDGIYNFENLFASDSPVKCEGTPTKSNVLWGAKRCTDCRQFSGASKNKPDWWPNDHK